LLGPREGRRDSFRRRFFRVPMKVVHKTVLVADGLTPVSDYLALREHSPRGSFLFESVVGGERWARYSILGYRPETSIVLFGEAGQDPFERLAELAPAGGEDQR